MFYVAYRTLLLMFCVLIYLFFFVDFYGMFTSSPTWAWRLKMHVLCEVGKNIFFFSKQNITSNVLQT